MNLKHLQGLVVLGWLLAAGAARGQLTYSGNILTHTATVTGYTGGGAVVIPASVKIGLIDYTVTTIGTNAFDDNATVTSVTIPSSVTSIDEEAFYACTSLTKLTFLGNAPAPGASMFYDVPGTVYYYYGTSGWDATYGGLPAVELDVPFTYITNNSEITITSYTGTNNTVTIPASINGDPVTALGLVFDYSSVTSVTVPNSVTNMDGETFWECKSLTNITVMAGNPDYSSVNGVLFNQNHTALIQFPAGLAVGSYTIPNSVTSIGDVAFAFSDLTNVTIPGSVTSIGEEALGFSGLTSVTISANVTAIYDLAFAYCHGLTNIAVAAGNPDYISVNGVLFDAAQTALIQYPVGLTNANYTIPNGVTGIGDAAFASSGLTSVTIPNSVTNIGFETFGECYRLTSAVIPNSVTSIGSYVFEDSASLTNVIIGNGVTSIGYEAFLDCFSLSNLTFMGNAPVLGSAFDDVNTNAVVYYYYGTSGWGSTYGGLPTVGLFPPPQIGGNVGIQFGNFGFTVTGVANQTIVVEASTNLVNWQPIWTNTSSSASVIFTDPQWKNYPRRFYRAR